MTDITYSEAKKLVQLGLERGWIKPPDPKTTYAEVHKAEVREAMARSRERHQRPKHWSELDQTQVTVS